MDEKNLISAAEASRVQAAGVNNLCNVLQGGPINGNSQTNSISANNYYIGSGETPGVGKPYEDGDKVTLKAQDGEEFSATVDLSKPGGSINVDDYENYNEANYDPNNIETKTALCAAPDVAFEQTANFMGGLDNFLAWGNSLIGNDEGKQFYLDKAAECEREENRVHEYFKGLAPDKNLYESKVRQGMLMVDMAMMASLAKDGVVLGVKVAGKMPKSIEELRAILMRCFGKTSYVKSSEILKVGNKESRLPSEIFKNDFAIEGQRLAPKNIHRELRKSDIGKETLDLIEDNNIRVMLDYSKPEPGSLSEGLLGQSFGPDKTITYVGNTQSVQKTAQNIIHEITHSVINSEVYTQREEIICRIREAKHFNPNLSASDIKNIINEVKELYPELPYN